MSLSLDTSYPCPLCRRGTLEAMVMTEAFACGFCRHILVADIPHQQVQVVDISQPLNWQWTGQGWRAQHQRPEAQTPWVWGGAGALLTLPPGVVALGGYCFPPLDPGPGLSFSQSWAIATALTHLLLVVWFVGSYYQVSPYLAAQVRGLLRQYDL